MTEEQRKLIEFQLRQTPHLVTSTIIVIGLLFGFLIWANNSTSSPLLVLIFLAGALGGQLNTYRRFQLIPAGDAAVAEMLSSRRAVLQIYMSPLIGGILGVVVYIGFLAGVIEGGFFPKFKKIAENYESLYSVLRNSVPETNKDAAKAVFWALIAGFSERFVPNILDKIAKKN